MSESEESWVLDSLVGFLRGPVWNLTIQAFVENKSVVFDSESPEEEVREEYRLVFEDYKKLVDRLLSSHMSDLGISGPQFDDALRSADGLLASKLRRLLFEQIWAANDFRVFVRFMTQRNIELQLQALEVLVQKFGKVYDSFVPFGENGESFLNEETTVKEAIRRSLEAEGEEEGDQKGEANALSEERRRLEAEVERQALRLENAIQEVIAAEDDVEEEAERGSPPTPVPNVEFVDNGRTVAMTTTTTTAETHSEPLSGQQSAEDMKKRSEYLRQQRDKLLAVKKRERDKIILRVQSDEEKARRPKSARAMRAPETEVTDDSALAFRRSLAARLKAEVIEEKRKQ